MSNYIDYIQDTYSWALTMGLARNKRDFAQKVCVNYSTISKILSCNDGNLGRLSGRECANKVRVWREAAEKLLNVDRWSQFRREAAKDFTSALVSSGSGLNIKTIAYAIQMADELIKQLQ